MLKPTMSFSGVSNDARGIATSIDQPDSVLRVETEAGAKTHKEKGFGWYLDLIQFKHPSFQNQYRHFADLILSNCKPRLSIVRP